MKQSPLLRAFHADHRAMTQSLYALLQAVKERDLARAIELAEQVDCVAGPHIAFEEEHFYPLLREPLGDAFVRQLYEEHAAGRSAVETLRECSNPEQLDPSTISRVEEQLEIAVQHARSCGTLASRLSGLEPTRAARLLRELDALRDQQRCWTDLPTP